MKNLQQQFVKGAVWSAIQSWGRQVVSFLVFLILARLLKPEVFGLISLASVFLAFIRVLLNQGFASAIIQRQELESEHLDTAFWSNLGIGLLLTFFGVASAGFFANFFKQPELTPIIQCLSLSFLIGALSQVQNAILSRKFAFKTLALRSLVAVVVGGIVGITLAFLGYGVWRLVGQQLVNEFTGVLVLWASSDWRPKLKFSGKHFRDLFSFGVNIMGIEVLNFFNRRSDDLLIGYFLGPVALGYYTVAYRVLLIMTQLLTSSISGVALPVFSRMQEEPERMRNAFYKAVQLTAFIAFPSFFGVAALAPEIVQVIFGEQWVPSIPVMQILAVIGVLHSILYFNDPVMMAMGKPSWRLALTSMNAFANLIAFLLVVRWGIVAIAAAYVIRGYLLAMPLILVVKKLISISLQAYFRQLIPPVLASLLMVIVLLGLKQILSDLLNLQLLLGIYVAIGALAYTIIILLIAPSIFQQLFNLLPLGMRTKIKEKL